MKKLIQNLRERPERDRRAIAMTAAGSVVTVLLCGWGITTLYTLNAEPAETRAAAAANSLPINQNKETPSSVPSYNTENDAATTTPSSLATTSSQTAY